MKSNFILHSIFAAFLLFSAAASAQNVSGTLVDNSTQKTIPFATVQLGENYGVVTNQEGNFSINTAGFSEKDSLIFSSMGYDRKAIALKDFEKGTVYLTKNVEELGEVLLLDEKLTALEVMEKVNEKKKENYGNSFTKFTVFHRSQNNNTFLDFDFEIRKAEYFKKKTLRKFNKTIDSLAETIRGVPTSFYNAYLTEIVVNKADSVKINLEKATELINKEKTSSLNALTEDILDGILENLKSANTFKVRTGIIPIADSLDVSEGLSEEEDIDSLTTKSVGNELEDLLGQSRLKTNNSTTISIGGGGSGAGLNFDFINELDDYEYEIEDISTFNGELIYIISFVPDSGLFSGNGKYTGKLYISADSFAVVKADYQLAEGKHGTKFNMKFLLGVKYEEKARSGIIIYEKNKKNKYTPKYIRVSGKRYGYFERYFVLKENDERTDRMKLKFEVMIEFDNGYKNEWLFVDSNVISEDEFANFKENKGVPIQEISEYNPEIWKEYNILAPTEAIREYEF
ncbi:MAG TPA: carboxypeptidase-like regulatory domain-containing protein [Flavobacteriaceae bacterium]|nr:carboxypeptidase-like regulatory domain-containing protein [Flavobacteriaceae bacterium]